MDARAYVPLALVLATGWWYVAFIAPNDEELTLRLLRDYEAAVAGYDPDAALALLADDYRGWRNSGKESVGQMIGWMEERGMVLDLDLTKAVVTVDADRARVSEVGNRMGQFESRATYLLVRTPDGWRIQGIEMER